MARHSAFLSCIGILCIIRYGYSHNLTTESDFIDSLLHPAVYNKVSRPFLVEELPVQLYIDLFISSISDISVITMDYKVNFFLRQRWQDPRLAFNNSQYNFTLTLNPARLPQLWRPSTYIANEKTSGDVHDVTVPNILLKLRPDGVLLYSQRISTTITCSMNLLKYPLDSQDCKLQLEIYSHTRQDVVLHWLNEDPLYLKKAMELPEFQIQHPVTDDCTHNYDSTGEFSCIEVRFTLSRRLGYYLIQLFVPSLLIVVLSWVSFWIDLYAVPARISVGLLSVLTITTQASSVNTHLPKVSYIKAVDVWMFTCTVFVFASLLEFSVVNVIARRQKLRAMKHHRNTIRARSEHQLLYTPDSRKSKQALKKRKPYSSTPIDSSERSNGDAIESAKNSPEERPATAHPVTHDVAHLLAPLHTWEAFKYKFRTDHALRVDVISRIMFPLLFAMFNLGYWLYYLMV